MSELLSLEPCGSEDLKDLLFEHGVEFPCGGDSLCGGCRIRVIEGDVPITEDMRDALTEAELRDGWRLGCQAGAVGPVLVEVEQWSVRILTDETALPFEPGEGHGAVVDLGTTTLVAQLVDLATGEVIGLETALNPQCRYGADVMSRIELELRQPGLLGDIIREAVGTMIADLSKGGPVREVLICGNTVMHHLFCGEDVRPLSHVPFRSPALAARRFDASELGWSAPVREGVTFLPSVGGFVGSDLLAGLVAVDMANSADPVALLDLGTNGEIAVGCREGIVCASTAAGPAFEGGRIRMGMRAGTGAVDKVTRAGDGLKAHVIGGGASRGICGSGLVDAVAGALDLEWVSERGRFNNGRKAIPLEGRTELVQPDIRELQLAKGAIRAGLEMLADGRRPTVFLAGAFGNYIRAESARRIGLLPAWAAEVIPAGNSALRGTRMLLLAPSRRSRVLEELLGRLHHVELAASPHFQEVFVEHMALAAN